MFIDDTIQFTTPLTAEQFATVLNAAYLAEPDGKVQFDTDLRDALNATLQPESVS
jgi:hypothetical protein